MQDQVASALFQSFAIDCGNQKSIEAGTILDPCEIPFPALLVRKKKAFAVSVFDQKGTFFYVQIQFTCIIDKEFTIQIQSFANLLRRTDRNRKSRFFILHGNCDSAAFRQIRRSILHKHGSRPSQKSQTVQDTGVLILRTPLVMLAVNQNRIPDF